MNFASSFFLVTIIDLLGSEEEGDVAERSNDADAGNVEEEGRRARLDSATSEDILLGLDVQHERFSDDELSSIVDDFGIDDVPDDEMFSFLDDVLGEKKSRVW